MRLQDTGRALAALVLFAALIPGGCSKSTSPGTEGPGDDPQAPAITLLEALSIDRQVLLVDTPVDLVARLKAEAPAGYALESVVLHSVSASGRLARHPGHAHRHGRRRRRRHGGRRQDLLGRGGRAQLRRAGPAPHRRPAHGPQCRSAPRSRSGRRPSSCPSRARTSSSRGGRWRCRRGSPPPTPRTCASSPSSWWPTRSTCRAWRSTASRTAATA